jgi:pimeloyl-ACP methyl ester carboxylesterase
MKRRTSALGLISTATAAVLVAAAAPAVAGSSATTSAPTLEQAAPGVGTIKWGQCESKTLQSLKGQCGMLSVPLDYAKPYGQKIKLAVSRIRHTVPDAKYQGIMLTNPGGPGGSGLTLSVLGQFVPNHVGDAYDWIGFDPRGVGSSQPALTCDPNYFSFNRPDYTPSTPALTKFWLTKSAGYSAACGKAAPDLIQHIKTTDSAQDMDSIRSALGAHKLNYYGFSYGTYLGQVYSTMYPHRVGRMVLDANVNPTRVWYAANLDQDVAFERNIKIWFGWVAKYDSVYHLGKAEAVVEALWYKQKARLTVKPAGGAIGPDEWTDIFLYAGYSQSTWTDLADLFAGWVHQGKSAALKAEYISDSGLGDDNGFAMYVGVQCSDVQWPQQWSVWKKDNTRVNKIAPFETWGNAWFNAPCLTWPAKPGTPVKVDGSKAPPILLVDETLDAATPYQGSLVVRNLFPKARLLALPGGTSHANSLFGNACEDNKIAAYLATGALPTRLAGTRADTYCKPFPQPVPGASVSLSNGANSSLGLAQRDLPAIMGKIMASS